MRSIAAVLTLPQHQLSEGYQETLTNTRYSCVCMHDCVRYASRDCQKNGWVCQGDGFVNSVAAEMITSFSSAFGGRCPWVVFNHLHRSKLDPNRDIEVVSSFA